ncbi:hypothetical protein DPMN_158899 [Dreissena polymorpha]|uniref:Uncharacterized protein n=1 Tax=Dreissena polymorpha TaxID=45954 RepID=A0A9D4EI41_DREPO|nr:hypothetical protein DPMN_158899 [Dreissena polymorpha]
MVKEKAIEFLNVCEEEWTNEISYAALHTLTDNKRNKQKMLSLSEDISKLQTHLQRTSESLTEALEERFFKHNWELLSKVQCNTGKTCSVQQTAWRRNREN